MKKVTVSGRVGRGVWWWCAGEEVRMGAGVDGGGVIPLWKMYWSSWKNRSPKKEKSRKI